MASLTATVKSPPLGFGRAILLIAVSLLLHAWALSVMRDQLVGPRVDAESAVRTIDAALITEAPPAPPPPPRVAPRRVVRPKPPPPPPAPAPVVQPAVESTPTPAALDDEPLRGAPGESDERISPAEVDLPVAPPADPKLVEARPLVSEAMVSGMDMVAEMREVGGALDDLPSAGSYVYKVHDSRYAAVSGTAKIDWRLDTAAQRYETRLRSTVFGIPLVDISSVGAVRRFGLAPERFVQKAGTRAPQAANVDWQQHIVTYSSRSYQRPAREGLQDWLSFQFQLMAMGQRLPHVFRDGTTISMDVTGPRDVEVYHLLVVGNETVETDAGPIETLKLDRPAVALGETRIEVWLAPSLRFLPVRTRFTDRRGNVTEMLFESADESR